MPCYIFHINPFLSGIGKSVALIIASFVSLCRIMMQSWNSTASLIMSWRTNSLSLLKLILSNVLVENQQLFLNRNQTKMKLRKAYQRLRIDVISWQLTYKKGIYDNYKI